MKITMRSAAVAGAMALLLSACGEGPTSSATIDPAGPSYDGGFTVGSGNRSAPADSSGMGTQSTATPMTPVLDGDGAEVGN